MGAAVVDGERDIKTVGLIGQPCEKLHHAQCRNGGEQQRSVCGSVVHDAV